MTFYNDIKEVPKSSTLLIRELLRPHGKITMEGGISIMRKRSIEDYCRHHFSTSTATERTSETSLSTFSSIRDEL